MRITVCVDSILLRLRTRHDAHLLLLQVVLSKGYGLRQSNDKSSLVTTSTLFQVGSVTKTFIAVGIAILVRLPLEFVC